MSAVAEQVDNKSGSAEGFIGRIPVRNLWFLMLYASDLFKDIGVRKRALEDNPDDIPELVAEILSRQVERRIKRNLSYGYQTREMILGRVRGRIRLLYTERHQLLERGRVACRFDELTVDTARNRFVRSALEKIAQIVREDKLAHRCRSLARSLEQMGVTREPSGRTEMSSERFGRHDADDQPMVSAAQLAFNLALPTEMAGSKYLPVPDRKQSWVRRLYEKGIAGFYDTILSERGWNVHAGRWLYWHIDGKSSGIDQFFPSMQTDIILERPDTGERIVIDTKFNPVLLEGRHGKDRLRSGHIYQIYAYLRSQEGRGGPLADNASGLLLHPSIGTTVDEWVEIQGHKIRFATVDLAAPSQEIRTRLLEVVEFPRD